MYQSWPLGGATPSTTAGYVQPTTATAGQDTTSQWPAAYGQYALTPEMQQQWAAWASQAQQYAYGGAMPMAGQVPGTPYAGVYPGFEAPKGAEKAAASTLEKPKIPAEETDQEEEEFERQFKDWEKQFESWKEQNANHPDKEAFAQYEKQWQDWRAQLLQKKEQMMKSKAEKAAAAAAKSAAVPGAAVADANAAANMYYQQSQYMYMQQYMQQYSQQYQYGAQGTPPVTPASGPAHGNPNAPVNPNENMNSGDMRNFEQEGGHRDYDMGRDSYPPEGDPYQEFGDYGNHNNSYPMDPQYQGDANFGRGRGRGRGSRGGGGRVKKGRGGRWDTNDGPNGNQGPALLANPPSFPENQRGPPKYNEGPPRDFPDSRRRPRDFHDGPEQYHDDLGIDGPPPFEFPTEDFDEIYPPEDRPFPDEVTRQRRGFPQRSKPPFDDRPDMPFHDGPPSGGFDDRFRPPPRDYPGERGPMPGDRGPMPGDRGPMPGDRGPMHGDRGPMPGDRGPPGDRFMRERDFDPYGPPPFDDYPPYQERFPPGRGNGRFFGRGRRYPPREDFDRFGPPPFPHEGPMDNFPPDDRFHPYERQERRGPPFRGRGGRGGRFPADDRPIFQEGQGPLKFDTVDYTHQPASAVMGEDFNHPPEYENDFQDDVMKYRDNFSVGINMAPHETVVFSEVKVESIDYAHGSKSVDSGRAASKELDYSNKPSAQKPVFDYAHQERSPNRNTNSSFDRHRNRSPQHYHENEHSRRDRNRDNMYPDHNLDRDFRDREFEGERSRSYDHDFRDQDVVERGRSHRDFRERDSRRDWDGNTDKNSRWENEGSPSEKANILPGRNETSQNKSHESESAKTSLIEDLLISPKRDTRPKQLVIILRGLPGSGKTYVAKLIKDKEIENGGSAPRILSLDDYFMTEVEVTDTDPDTKKQIKRKEFKFEYEIEMEESYRTSLFKSFKKTIDDRFFPFIIVDAVNEKSKHYSHFWSYAKPKGFQVYIAEMDCKDPLICHKQNIHNRSLEEITKSLNCWEKKPQHFMSVDIRSLLQAVAITEVEMEVASNDGKEKESESKDESETKPDDEEETEESTAMAFHVPSKWENFEATEEKLYQLDGLRASKKKHSSMEDYLQLPDDYDDRKCEPGKKRVRWADLEERKEQDRIRAIGFVVGQTDWNKMTDPSHADKALTKTKYF